MKPVMLYCLALIVMACGDDDAPGEKPPDAPCIYISDYYQDCRPYTGSMVVCYPCPRCLTCPERDGDGCWVDGSLMQCLDECPPSPDNGMFAGACASYLEVETTPGRPCSLAIAMYFFI